MPFQVQITDQAEATVDEVFRWIAERSPDGALRWRAEFDRAGERLEESADTFPLAPESDMFPEPVREVYFKTRRGRKYRVLFVVRDEIVTIFAIRGPGQDLISPNDVTLPD
jgi:plasmid stabilization system protein ParE